MTHELYEPELVNDAGPDTYRQTSGRPPPAAASRPLVREASTLQLLAYLTPIIDSTPIRALEVPSTRGWEGASHSGYLANAPPFATD